MSALGSYTNAKRSCITSCVRRSLQAGRPAAPPSDDPLHGRFHASPSVLRVVPFWIGSDAVLLIDSAVASAVNFSCLALVARGEQSISFGDAIGLRLVSVMFESGSQRQYDLVRFLGGSSESQWRGSRDYLY